MTNDVLTRAIDALASGHDLAQEEASAVLAEIMAGNASEAQIAAFLIALRTKGETVDELAGLAGTMRALATPDIAPVEAAQGYELPVTVVVTDASDTPVFRAKIAMWVSARTPASPR